MTSTAATIDVLLRANTAAYRAEMVRSARETADRLGSIRKEAASTAVSIANLNKAAAGFIGFQAVTSGVRSLVEAQKSIQQIHYGLQGATGSAAAADKAYGFVAQTAKELGLNLEGAAKSFTGMSAAASANGIAMRDQQDLFRQLSRSATVMHLTSEQMGRATTALGQSFSKGKFQAEELRQQLGEAIPGIVPRFMQAVAQMNEGTALAGKSFDKLLQDGDLNVQKYLPAMIKALEATGSGAEEAAKGLSAELNRLSTAWFNLKVNASSGVFSDTAIASVRLMAENLDKVAGAAAVAGGVIAGRVIGIGARNAYGAVAGPIAERTAASGQAKEMASLARERAKEAAEQVNQARESVRLATAWKAQSAVAADTARGQLGMAAAANEAAQATLRHQEGALTLSANLRAQRDAQAAAVIAQRNLARAQAEYNAAVTSGNLADAKGVQAKGRLIAAQEAAAIATNNLTAARAREAAAGAAGGLAGMAGSAARAAGTGLLALAGGPWGAAAIAIGALGMAYVDAKRKSEDARKEFEEQAKSLGVLTFAIKDATEQYKNLNGSVSLKDLAAVWNESGVAVRKADHDIAALTARITEYEAKLATARTKLEVGAGGAGDINFYTGQLQQARADLAKLTAEAAPARAAFLEMQETLRTALDPKAFEELRAAALKADDVKFNSVLAGLSDVQRQAIGAADAIRKISQAGTDEVWKRQVDRLKRERGEYMSWLATEGKKYMDATGKATFNEAWQVMSPEQKAEFQARAKFVREDVAAEKAWNEQQKANKATAREVLSDARAQENQYQSIIDRVQRQIALDKEQMGLTDDMTAAQKLQVIVTNEMKSAKDKLSDAEKVRVRSLLDEAVAQGKSLAAQESAKKAAQELLRVQNQLSEARRSQLASNSADLAGLVFGSDTVERMRRQVDLQREYQRQLEELNQRSAAGHYSTESYRQQREAIKAFYRDALADEASYQEDRARMQAQWGNGFIRAYEEMRAEAADFASQSYDAITGMFQDGEEAAVRFAQTGKLSFSSLVDSMIADMARVAYRQGMTGLFSSAYNAVLGSTIGPVQRERISIPGWDDGGWTGPGGKYDVAGLVHKDEGVLSKEDMAALGGPSAFHALRRALRRGYAGGGIGGQPSGPAPALPIRSGGSGDLQVEINNYGGNKVQARQVSQRRPDGSELRKLVIDIVGESLDAGELGAFGRSKYGWTEAMG